MDSCDKIREVAPALEWLVTDAVLVLCKKQLDAAGYAEADADRILKAVTDHGRVDIRPDRKSDSVTVSLHLGGTVITATCGTAGLLAPARAIADKIIRRIS